MQHWVFCEILAICSKHATRFDFVDAHSMAPIATSRPVVDQYALPFDNVAGMLPGQGSVYEKAWKILAPSLEIGYPNSANFLATVWRGEWNMLLCESCAETVIALRLWANTMAEGQSRQVEIFSGEWRDRFQQDLDPTGDFVFVSFDPYMVSQHEHIQQRDQGNMYPEDLDIVKEALGQIDKPIIVELSTYSANGDNTQEDVIAMARDRFAVVDLTLTETVKANGNMMSMVFTRNLP